MDWKAFISQYDLLYHSPPDCWQDGLINGNGSIGTVFHADETLHWEVNKTDVIDGRVRPVKRILTRQEAEAMVRAGARARDFEEAERGPGRTWGIGPKTACRLSLAPGYTHMPSQRVSPPEVDCRLGLYDATLRLHLRKHMVDLDLESRVLATADVALLRLRGTGLPGRRTCVWFTRPRDEELPLPTVTRVGDDILIRQELPNAGHYVAACRAVRRPSQPPVPWADRVRPHVRPKPDGSAKIEVIGQAGLFVIDGDFDLLTTVVTSRDADDPAAAAPRQLDRAIAELDDLLAAHDRWWANYWQRSWVELGNKAEEQLFYMSLYAMACAYRGAPISGLLGLVYGPGPDPIQSTPWHGDIHNDLNVQCPFFPVHMVNHPELFDAYIETFANFLPEAKSLARKIFGVDGAHFDMCLTALGKSVQGGVGNYRFALMGSYVGLLHALCWRYWRDEEQMRQWIAPFLEEVIRFYLAIARREGDTVHFWPAHAAELDIPDTADPVQTVSMLRACIETYLEAPADAVDPTVRSDAAKLLAALPPYPTGTDWAGREVVLEAVGVPADHHVGQAGCLHPVYPCGEVDALSDPATVDLYSRTLDSVCEKTAQRVHASHLGFHYDCVWQCFFRALTALRLGRAADVHGHYWPMFLACFAKPNGLVAHDSSLVVDPDISEQAIENIPEMTLQDTDDRMPLSEAWFGHRGCSTPNPAAKRYSIAVIEGSADYLTMVTEMLLQSQRGIIRLFPGWWPDRDARFDGLVAEGGIRVSARRRNGKVDFVRLSGSPGDVRILSPWSSEVETWTIPASGILCRPEDATPPAPAPPEAAAIRTLYEDDQVRIILGKRAPDRTT